ncbi:hypothetical protein IVA80_06245 [Bradyrhizobium sp. 139]|uniref:hypothetical protein n=1 Tax=Bradyrhizobium sp. 139 TaxID=2782616 RepID=UPI001FF8DEB4|nr:hypothetical protein [Bradyrhizobium sp. 139]MCK1740475.1 hypothetical protein [Bradyrhizobium sp. 139]
MIDRYRARKPYELSVTGLPGSQQHLSVSKPLRRINTDSRKKEDGCRRLTGRPFSSQLTTAGGRAGIIVRTGIATDSSTSVFFRDLVANRKLFSLHDFQTGLGYFDNIGHARFKFCLLTLGQANIRPRGRCHRARR